MVGGIAASGVFYIGCPRCARVEVLLFFLPDVVLYHTVPNLQLFSLGWTYAFKTHMNTIWIHIEITCNSRTETQYRGETCSVNTKIKQMLTQ
jgi:hypothetical protein